MPDRQEQWAVFWCSLLGPLLYGEVPPEEAGPFLNQLASTEHLFPDGQRRRPSRATVWRKWKQYRDGGFERLFRKRRKDRGKPRKATPAMVAKAIELKKEQPRRSNVPINQFLQAEFHATIPKSTLYRHLKRAGATRLKLGVSRQKVRRRWTRDFSNALWLGDFEDGPCVLEGDQAVTTHLSALIDCHSRYVPEARYYLRENLDILEDSLLRAWSVHGASHELYLDNAKIYHAHALKAACCALNIRLIHRGVGDAPPGGLIERFFETAQGQFESEVRAGEILTLDRLNRTLAAWLEVTYHQQIHSETGQTPLQRLPSGESLHPTRQPARGPQVLPAQSAAHGQRDLLRCATGHALLPGHPGLAATEWRCATIPSVRWKPYCCTPWTASIWGWVSGISARASPNNRPRSPGPNPNTTTLTC